MKIVGVSPLRGLPGVERGAARSRRPSGIAAGERSQPGASHCGAAPRPRRRRSISIWRRTNRHGDAGRRARLRATASSRSRGASGIVTSTSSGRAAPSRRASLVEAAEHLDAEHAPAAQTLGLSSRKPTTLLARRLAQLAGEAAGPTGRRRRSASARAAVRRATERSRSGAIRSARREPATSALQRSASTRKISSGKSPSVRRQRRRTPSATSAETSAAAAIASRSRGAAKRQTRR